MKLAFCVEDDTDEDLFRILLSRALRTDVTADEGSFRLRRGGWAQALQLAPIVARAAHQRGLEGAVFAIDNDGAAPLHQPSHRDAAKGCRLCELRAAARIEVPLSWPRPGLTPLRYVFAVPVQAIETWLLLAQGHDFKGQAETLGQDANGRRQLKRLLYGVEFPERERMRSVALPLAESLELDALARVSPSFEAFLTQLR